MDFDLTILLDFIARKQDLKRGGTARFEREREREIGRERGYCYTCVTMHSFSVSEKSVASVALHPLSTQLKYVVFNGPLFFLDEIFSISIIVRKSHMSDNEKKTFVHARIFKRGQLRSKP